MNMMEQIRDAIIDSNISHRQIAINADISESTMNNIVQCKRDGVNSLTLEEFARVLGKKFVLVDIVPEIIQELEPSQTMFSGEYTLDRGEIATDE